MPSFAWKRLCAQFSVVRLFHKWGPLCVKFKLFKTNLTCPSSGLYHKAWSLIWLDEIIWFSFRSCCLDQYPDWHVRTWERERYSWHCCLWLPHLQASKSGRDWEGSPGTPFNEKARRNNEKTVCQRCFRDPIRQFKSLPEMTNEALTPVAAIGPLGFF